MIAEKYGSVLIVYLYDENGSPIGMQFRMSSMAANTFYTFWFEKNLQGDIIAVYNESGTKLISYFYDAWGNVTQNIHVNSGTNAYASLNPFRYRGYYYDTESKLYYLNSRYYNPEIGRFINADSTDYINADGSILSCNLFAYCNNNPVNDIDAEGTLSWKAKLAIGLAVIAAAAVLTVATAGTGTGLACFAVGALKGAVSGALIGAATGAATGAVKHRIETGSWEGAGEAALEGAADGFMSGAITGFIMGGVTSSACFVAGTVVLASVGYIAIEDIKAGDFVWATDPDTGETALKRVAQTFINESDKLVHVTVNGEEIVCTNEHPFYSPVKGWTAACDLRAGDILVLVNGKYVVVEHVQHELLESPINVYNFEVEDFHTYYVGDTGVLVHNKCLSNAEARAAAEKLGYKKVNGQFSHGKAIFENPKASAQLRYITADVDQHSGGVWKAASSIRNLASKATRSGTYDELLRWIAP